METELKQLGKKFGRTWIFRNLDYTFKSDGRYAILGSNGSGKSTLLQIISGYQSPSAGTISYSALGKSIAIDHVYSRLTLATPYMELPEEFTLTELLAFHSKFKAPEIPLREIPEKLNLEKEVNKEIKNFSSGMRQRVRLGLALLYKSGMVLLDEPTTHLDAKAVQWYQNLLIEHTRGKCLIISSNQPEEYEICDQHIHMENFKQNKQAEV